MRAKPHLQQRAIGVVLTPIRETPSAWGVSRLGAQGPDILVWLPKSMVGLDPRTPNRFIGPEWLFRRKGLV